MVVNEDNSDDLPPEAETVVDEKENMDEAKFSEGTLNVLI